MQQRVNVLAACGLGLLLLISCGRDSSRQGESSPRREPVQERAVEEQAKPADNARDVPLPEFPPEEGKEKEATEDTSTRKWEGSDWVVERRETSKDGKIAVFYRIINMVDVFLQIDTHEKKPAFEKSLQLDLYTIKVDFTDFNNDGVEDVMVRYEDEQGFTMNIFFNRDYLSFSEARFDVEPYVVEYFYMDKDDNHVDVLATYELKDVTGDGMPDIIFSNAHLIGMEAEGLSDSRLMPPPLFHSVVYRFDAEKAMYFLHDKSNESRWGK